MGQIEGVRLETHGRVPKALCDTRLDWATRESDGERWSGLAAGDERHSVGRYMSENPERRASVEAI